MKYVKSRIPSIVWILALIPLTFLVSIIGSLIEANVISWYFRVLLLSGIFVTAAVSLNIVNGFTGQFSIGHAGFMLIGAYASALITHPDLLRNNVIAILHIPRSSADIILFPIALLMAAVCSAIFGLLVGLPSLRLRGDYLAIATLGFGEAIRAILVTVEAVGGASGLHEIPMITSFTWVFMAAVLVVLTSRGIARSRHGRALFAIREDELAAGAAGIDVFRYKVLAFVISSAWAGVAGALLSHLNGGISPDQYGFMLSFSIVVMVVLGGLGSITGAVIAAFLLTWPPELMRQFSVFGYSLSPYRLVIYPILLIILMFLRPQGLFGRKELSLTSILGGKRGGSS